MGQKTNPISLRLGLNKTWDSLWYSEKNYNKLLHEDLQVRVYLSSVFQNIGVLTSKCLIKRSTKKVIVLLHVYDLVKDDPKKLSKNIIEARKNFNINKIKNTLQKLTNSEIHLYLYDTPVIAQSAKLLATYIATELERRYTDTFQSISREALMKIKKYNSYIKGIDISCSGRLNKIKMAKTAWQERDRVQLMPLHTFNASIDYAQTDAFTSSGVLGIKVWICYE